MSIATVTTLLRHQVRLVHATSGTPVTGLAARLEPPTWGWSLRVVGGVVVVSSLADLPATSVPPSHVSITVTDGAAADVLVIPPVPGEPPRTVLAALTAPEVDVPLDPVPMTLTVVLTTPSTGAPRTGRTLVARARTGPNPKPTIPLPEVSPGTYRSAPVTWTAPFVPADLLVGTRLLRVLSVDLSTTSTRIHLVDTT